MQMLSDFFKRENLEEREQQNAFFPIRIKKNAYHAGDNEKNSNDLFA